MKTRIALLLLVLLIQPLALSLAQTSTSVYQRLQKLGESATVLYIAAHPDDENTHLIAWLSQEKKFRTAYMALTRGDGGQNLIGPELGVDLGLIRTRELMSARTIDGGEQYFSRAFDFGFSKKPEETLSIWEKEKVLEDIVRVIRTVKPDMIICRFPPDQRAGHGHHSSSAILAHEAFLAAADPIKFPNVPYKGASWKTNSIFWNTFTFGNPSEIPQTRFKVEIGGYNALTGKSYGELAAESRSQHKSQGFGVASERNSRIEYFIPVDGDTANSNLFDFSDHYFSASSEGKNIKAKIDTAIKSFDILHPERSVTSLLELYEQFSRWNVDPAFKDRKIQELSQIITDCMGLWTALYSTKELFADGDSIPASLHIIARNIDGITIDVQSSNLISGNGQVKLAGMETRILPVIFKGSERTTQPYWLLSAHNRGMFAVEDASMIGQPWNKPAIDLLLTIHYKKYAFNITVPVRYKLTDPVRGELERPLVISPVLTGTINETVSVFNTTSPRTYKLHLSYHGAQGDSIHLKAIRPAGANWKVSFNDSTIYFSGKGEGHLLKFTLQPLNISAGSEELTFTYSIAGEKNVRTLGSLREINYPHIPKITWFPSLEVKMVAADIKTTAKKVLYIKGAGDEVAAMIRQLGITVDEVTVSAMEEINLNEYDAIVTGIRAFNTDPTLSTYFEKITGYIKQGGIFLIQYNTNNNLHPVEFTTPAPFLIGRSRVTEEDAPVQFALPDDPVLTKPNPLTPNDFKNWVQERGLYFATDIDPHYHQPLLMHDQGEKDLPGSLIVLPVGKGVYIYTGLSFFRQLPAGIPGAFRLFANLISRP